MSGVLPHKALLKVRAAVLSVPAAVPTRGKPPGLRDEDGAVTAPEEAVEDGTSGTATEKEAASTHSSSVKNNFGETTFNGFGGFLLGRLHRGVEPQRMLTKFLQAPGERMPRRKRSDENKSGGMESGGRVDELVLGQGCGRFQEGSARNWNVSSV